MPYLFLRQAQRHRHRTMRRLFLPACLQRLFCHDIPLLCLSSRRPSLDGRQVMQVLASHVTRQYQDRVPPGKPRGRQGDPTHWSWMSHWTTSLHDFPVCWTLTRNMRHGVVFVRWCRNSMQARRHELSRSPWTRRRPIPSAANLITLSSMSILAQVKMRTSSQKM